MKSKIFKMKWLWRGLTAVLALLLALSIFGTACAMQYKPTINGWLGAATSKVVSSKEDANADLDYYKSSYGAYNEANLRKLLEDVNKHIAKEEEEGAVLMKNDNKALPLSSEKNISLFGFAAYDPLYHTSAAGSRSYKYPEYTTDFKEAFESAGFKINETLYNAYGSMTARTTAGGFGPPGVITDGNKTYTGTGNCEAPKSIYTSAVTSTFADYNEAAIVVLAREAGEGRDMAVSETDATSGATLSSLALHQNEKDMLEIVKNGGFKKRIVIVNTTYFLELDWLDEYDIDACLWIGSPGNAGLTGVANIIKGTVNPSGRLSDTWAADSLSSPAVVNEAGNIREWSNLAEIRAGGIVTDEKTTHYAVEAEGIYVGYKYYETRYADVIMNKGGASAAVGSFRSKGNSWNYADEMCFTFGWGMSYTTFTQKIVGVKYDAATDKYDVQVRVVNTGNTPGKCAVIVYAQTPYGDYEKNNGVEKSAIQFVGYDKTDVIASGAEVTVHVPVDRYLLASYDTNGAEGYILSGGDYYFAVGDSAHDALNNVLSVQGYSGMIDQDGTVDNSLSAESVYKLTSGVPSDNSAPDTRAYYNSKATGRRVTNQFAESDINYWSDKTGVTVKYLTRSDWAGTFPTSAVVVGCVGEEMQTLLQGATYKMSDTAKATFAKITQGAKNGLTFLMMKDVDYEDDVTWNKFLDQLSIEELCTLLPNVESSFEVPSIGLPQLKAGDGCNGTDQRFANKLGYGNKTSDNTYLYFGGNYSSVIAATWNKVLQKARGELLGEELLFLQDTETWTGGCDLRRTPFSGRNEEYYSEDANVNYYVGNIQLSAEQAKGVIAGPKHFCGNDWESGRNGVAVFYNEQSFREGSLRGFEGALRNDLGGVLGTMSSYARQGLTYTPSCYALNTIVLREEWGYKGHVITDACTSDYGAHWEDVFMGGSDTICFDFSAVTKAYMTDYLNKTQDGDMLLRVRSAAKNFLYALTKTNGINGLSANSIIVPITPAWQIALYVIIGIIAVLTAGAAVMYVLSRFVFNKEDNDNA